jgi:citrate lyase subunit beta/citryl-CoA lyase
MKIATTGNAGPKIRSDCEVILELRDEGGLSIDIKSKVKALYGESIKNQCIEILNFFGIKNAILKIDDSGALPFVISARVEAAIKKLIETDLEYLPELIPENTYPTKADRFRFSRLYLPGNNPSIMINAGLHSADGIILDLEDSVSPSKKDEALILVRNALRQIDFSGAERMVRINQGKQGIYDLECLVKHNVNLVIVPKCESHEQLSEIISKIEEIRSRHNLINPVFLMPVIESALGVENAFSIAKASANVVAIAIGLEDYTADLGVPRTLEGRESFYARTRLVVAAKAAGIQPIDSVFSDVGDMEALKRNVLDSRALGFEGMGCIHPRQIAVIRKAFSPNEIEIKKAKDIVFAFKEAQKDGLSVVALGTKMIDPPVVAKAQKTINLAIRLQLIHPDWTDIENENNC